MEKYAFAPKQFLFLQHSQTFVLVLLCAPGVPVAKISNNLLQYDYNDG